MTRDERRRIAVVLGVPSLLGHGVVALLAAKLFLGLPMEAGGLFLGPVLGMPLAGFGLTALLCAVLMPWRPASAQVAGSLIVALCFDGFALMVGAAPPWPAIGLALTLGSLGFLATTLELLPRRTSGF